MFHLSGPLHGLGRRILITRRLSVQHPIELRPLELRFKLRESLLQFPLCRGFLASVQKLPAPVRGLASAQRLSPAVIHGHSKIIGLGPQAPSRQEVVFHPRPRQLLQVSISQPVIHCRAHVLVRQVDLRLTYPSSVESLHRAYLSSTRRTHDHPLPCARGSPRFELTGAISTPRYTGCAICEINDTAPGPHPSHPRRARSAPRRPVPPPAVYGNAIPPAAPAPASFARTQRKYFTIRMRRVP